MNTSSTPQSWQASIRAFWHPQVISLLFLGLSAGIPILLIFSSLGLWLREAGIERSTVTLFSWAALGYSFKFVWAPLIDRLPVPILTRLLGRRRAWILVSQLSIITAIVWMASIDPSANNNSLLIMALATVLLGFSSATQDIVIDAYRIESGDKRLQALMSSTYIAGYRIGMIIAGAGALFLADYFGSDMGAYHYEAWRNTYFLMAASMLIGVITTFIIIEPHLDRSEESNYTTQDYLGFLVLFILAVSAFIAVFILSANIEVVGEFKQSLGDLFANPALASFLIETLRLLSAGLMAYWVAKLVTKSPMVNATMVESTYIAPVKDFFSRYNFKLALLLLALIGLYRISDIVLGVIANVFYQDLHYTKTEIATIVKTFGLFMTLAGGFLGGILSLRYGVMRILFVGAVLTVITNLLFVLLAQVGHSTSLLYVVISADNLTAGLASAAFIAFLSSLTNIQFTAVQYAIFSSLMTLLPKVLGGYSGAMVDSLGYENFFIIASIMGLPVLVLVWLANKHLTLSEFKLKD